MRIFSTHLLLESLLTHRQAKNRLTTAAARSAVTHAPCLQQCNFVAALRQMQSRGTAGDPAAEHRYIATDFAAQWRAVRPDVIQSVVRGGRGKGQAHGL